MFSKKELLKFLEASDYDTNLMFLIESKPMASDKSKCKLQLYIYLCYSRTKKRKINFDVLSKHIKAVFLTYDQYKDCNIAFTFPW